MDTSAAIRLTLELAHAVNALRRAAWLRPPGELGATVNKIEAAAAHALEQAQRLSPRHGRPDGAG